MMTEVLWIFIVITALQPIFKQKLLDSSRLRLLTRFEKARSSRAIALVHRQETTALLGFPVMKYIDVNDSEGVLRAIKLTDPSVPLDLIVHSPGGLVLAAAQIANALKRHSGKVTCVREEAKELGLPVSTDMPPEVCDFMRLFAQPTRTRPSVEYVPLPHRNAGSGGS